MLFADVIIDISHSSIDKSFQYIIPLEMVDEIRIGSVVEVPFGKGNNLKKAFVVGVTDKPAFPVEKQKNISKISAKNITAQDQLISLAMWMARYYGATKASAINTVLPVRKKTAIPVKRQVSLKLSIQEAQEYLESLTSKKRYSIPKERLVRRLLEDSPIGWEIITGKLNIGSSVIRDLEKQGIVEVTDTRKEYIPDNKLSIKKKEITLNEQQQKCVDTFVSDFSRDIHHTYLLHGITGSGKTEVYLSMIEACLKQGREAIVLIPEIALTYQTLMRFYHKFGNLVSVMNSRLSEAEKYDVFDRAKRGEIKIVIGPRSALFTPFINTGLIIIDEEHESSYKSEKMPRYHARETAIERARLSGASVVLGSATPSIESYHRAVLGEYKLLTLTHRAMTDSVASCEIVDMRTELKEGNRSVISRALHEKIEKTIADGKQVMLFLNRRGMLGTISCRSCGQVIKCKHCDVSLTYHKDGRLHCHYCGYKIPMPKTCPECGSSFIGGFKAGTEKIEMQVQEEFPDARVIRMDADTTKGKDGHEEILAVFANKGADILIGTQMIVKGHDFADVALVGVLAADLSLNVSDFRAQERTFNLLTQAAGRAGRADTKGEVVIQTYQPEHYAVMLAAAQDYVTFYNKEIAYRKILRYPPVVHILLIMVAGKDENMVERVSKGIKNLIQREYKDIWSSDAVSPYISKIDDVHRRMVYLKSENENELFLLRDRIDKALEETKTNVSVYYDLDPLMMN